MKGVGFGENRQISKKHRTDIRQHSTMISPAGMMQLAANEGH